MVGVAGGVAVIADRPLGEPDLQTGPTPTTWQAGDALARISLRPW